jgi:hypothetical protein
MRTKLIQTAALIAVFFLALWLMPKPAPEPQLTELKEQADRIEAATRRTETVAGWVYDQQSYEIYMRDWRGGK